jgi:hypothetical protein
MHVLLGRNGMRHLINNAGKNFYIRLKIKIREMMNGGTNRIFLTLNGG